MSKIVIAILFFLTSFFISAQTKIRLGDGTYSSNKVLFTIDGTKVRQGDGTYLSNKVLFTIGGNLSITKIACLLYYIR